MQVVVSQHYEDELFEQYAMGRLQPFQRSAFEEHLLTCQDCQARVSDFDDYIQAIRAAARELQHDRELPDPSRAPSRLWHIPTPLWAAAVAAALFLVAIPFKAPFSKSTEVYLATERGFETRTAGSGTVVLNLDAAMLPATPAPYRLQLVDSSGTEIWTARLSPRSGHIVAPVPFHLKAGMYWVRLFADSAPTPLQEFALRLN